MSHETVLSDAEIELAAQCLDAEAQSDGETVTVTLKNVKQCLYNLEQALLQSSKLQQLRKDAERYRWLKDPNSKLICIVALKTNSKDDVVLILDDADRAIDTAMEITRCPDFDEL